MVNKFWDIQTDEFDFDQQMETLRSRSFLSSIQQMRGMGALSDAEGKKLTDAVGALNPSMSEKAFKESLTRIKADLLRAKSRIGKSIGQPMQEAPSTQQAPRSREEILNQYGL